MTIEIVDTPLNPLAPPPTDPSANHTARGRKLGLGMLTVYGSGALVQDTAVFALSYLLLFYLTVVCGMSGSLAGLALGVALVVDSFVDPLVGSLSDNSRSRHGRRHPWMIASAVPLVVGFGLLFSIPVGLGGWALFAYALTLILVVRFCISAFQVPYIALGAELSDDYRERSTIVAARVLFTVLGTFAAAFLAYGVFMKGIGGQTHREAYPPFAWSCGAVILAGAALSSFGTLSARGRLHAAAPGQTTSLASFLAEVAEVFRNPSFRVLFIGCLVLFISMGTAAALTLHANTYFWKLPTSAILLVTLVGLVGIFLGVFLAAGLTQVVEKRVVALTGVFLVGLCQLAPAALQVSGLLPPGSAVLLLSIFAAVSGVGISMALIGFQSMMADAADEHEHMFGARREGLFFAGISLAAKASTGLGAMLGGLILDVIGFPHGLDAAGKALVVAVPAETIRNLGLAYGPGASVITGVAVVILLGYRRTRKDHELIREALEQRRAGATG
ncbi:GPH family glycoside/pentoside/hexuronide:cation symporter [Caulobacter ginsengisoli]|uniref:GPH family glycoside/pentoside/hexuronide:cation symporter n=1 Tax=Caulobacter ginsengisoli TaxID=400775 RepID=A0ABU0IUS8_9CAUL|nr:MFS transporter [Caulobacter ginsengisoli]MDQ0465771.1 GPH family glycoside/pentoside/hexuronide:cation symporter [Caulobacter ginsengisoli]